MPISARKRIQLTVARPRRAAASRQARPARGVPPKPVNLGALNRHLGYFIRRAQVWVFQDIIRALKSLAISPAQYSVLLVIDANPGLSQTALARTLGIQRARLVRLLHKLDKRGLTRRLPSSADGRANTLRLTAKGQDTVRRAAELAARHEARLIEKLGAEPYRLAMNILRDFPSAS
jgi:DNA-binding MarR family transcriptional regulator